GIALASKPISLSQHPSVNAAHQTRSSEAPRILASLPAATSIITSYASQILANQTLSKPAAVSLSLQI
ncbi:hypothetical protein PTTG_30986, partial [Puccinia triticina 1-1 BBBD Race 1]